MLKSKANPLIETEKQLESANLSTKSKNKNKKGKPKISQSTTEDLKGYPSRYYAIVLVLGWIGFIVAFIYRRHSLPQPVTAIYFSLSHCYYFIILFSL